MFRLQLATREVSATDAEAAGVASDCCRLNSTLPDTMVTTRKSSGHCQLAISLPSYVIAESHNYQVSIYLHDRQQWVRKEKYSPGDVDLASSSSRASGRSTMWA